MKRILVLSFILLSIVFSSLSIYSQNSYNSEEQEIINAATESYKIFDYFTGCTSNMKVYVEDTEVFFSPFTRYQFYRVGDSFPNCVEYVKTNLRMDGKDDYQAFLQKYFSNLDVSDFYVFVDTENQGIECTQDGNITVVRTQSEKYPEALIFDGVLYVKSYIGLAYTIKYYADIENGKVISNDGNNAVVEFDVKDGKGDTFVLCNDVTITLEKTDEGWKINGGTIFSTDFIVSMGNNWFKNPPPQTGENTFFYIVISASALACMMTLLARRRRERV